jgi:hypothetical protein
MIRADLDAQQGGARGKKAEADSERLFLEHIEDLLGKSLAEIYAEQFEDEDGNALAPEDVAFNADIFGGYVIEARIAHVYDYERDAIDILKALLAAPSLRLLGKLTLGMPSEDGDNDYAPMLDVLTRGPALPALRKFHLGDFVFPDDCELSWMEVGDVGPALKKMPNLVELTLQGANIGLPARVSLPDLTSLTVITSSLKKTSARALCTWEVPAIENLTVWFGSNEYGCDAKAADIAPMLADAKRMPKLAALCLCNAEEQDAIAALVARSPLAPQLEVLHLHLGLMGEEGAASLIAHRAAFKRLAELDVSENYLEGSSIQALKKAFGNKVSVNAGDQKEADDDDDDWRYVSVGECPRASRGDELKGSSLPSRLESR